MNEEVLWRIVMGGFIALASYFFKQMLSRLDKGNEELAKLTVNVARMIEKQDHHSEKIKEAKDDRLLIWNEINKLKSTVGGVNRDHAAYKI